jgi:hypothetical protein
VTGERSGSTFAAGLRLQLDRGRHDFLCAEAVGVIFTHCLIVTESCCGSCKCCN